MDNRLDHMETLLASGACPLYAFAVIGGSFRYVLSRRWHADFCGLTGSHKTDPAKAVRNWLAQARRHKHVQHSLSP
jgi:hypothetical protein